MSVRVTVLIIRYPVSQLGWSVGPKLCTHCSMTVTIPDTFDSHNTHDTRENHKQWTDTHTVLYMYQPTIRTRIVRVARVNSIKLELYSPTALRVSLQVETVEIIATSANQIVPPKLEVQKCCTFTRPPFPLGGVKGGSGFETMYPMVHVL